ncbi:MAG: DNA gyrase C-terminal beta-propeller domain-containing protein, partial [Actinomycetota bacterium]
VDQGHHVHAERGLHRRVLEQVPRTLNLRELLVAYVEHQREVIRRRSEYRLRKAQDRAHIVEGLLRALDMIDEIIAAIRASEDRAEAKERLMGEGFEFSDVQAQFILDMQLARLTRLARSDLENELAALQQTIAELEAILGDPARLDAVIKEELAEIREEFATDRLTALMPDPGELDIEDLIDDEDLVVTLTSSGYIKSVSADEFRAQGRGGRGVTGAKLKDDDEDLISHLLHTTAHAYLLFFSNRGRVYRIKAHEIPITSRTSRGMALVNLLQLQADEQIQAIVDTRDYETNRFLFFATRQGRVKKTLFTAYDSSLRSGLIAIKLNDGDELVSVVPTNGTDDIFMASRNGQALRFSEDDVRAMGRTAAGVVGMKFRDGDELVSSAVFAGETELLVVSSQGLGKRIDPALFTRKKRAGLGVRCLSVSDRTGNVVGSMFVAPGDEVLLVSSGGVVIRTSVDDISQQGRDASGVKVMSPPPGESVTAVARLFTVEDDETADEGDGADNADDAVADVAATVDGSSVDGVGVDDGLGADGDLADGADGGVDDGNGVEGDDGGPSSDGTNA